MIVAVNVMGDQVGAGLGRAHTMAVASVEDGAIVSWETHEVRWDISHDAGTGLLQIGAKSAGDTHGSHHARIVSFLRDNAVEVLVTGHMGPPMAHTVEALGIVSVVGATGDARQAALDAVALVNDALGE
ncbi:MAG: hypothetical protein LBN10_03600 [Propionibacteriaceae bacterium]|jgi:predicted Fe-Mo cluster-binding NifX family protein|nr:hypothetical protein [Propionibacteriaceae bacterium]